MIGTLLLKVYKRMYDRTVASMIALVADGSVNERTVRNWIGKCTTPDQEMLDRVLQRSTETLRKDLEEKEWSDEQRESFVNRLRDCPGAVSAFALTLQNGGSQYPAFFQLASEIDLLEQALAIHRENGDVQGWAQTLLDAKWIRGEQLTNPDDGTSEQDTRRQLREAQSWEELDRPAAVFLINTQFQLLATLDLEFCSTYLPEWEATPIFGTLLPRLNPRVDLAGKTSIRTTRNLYHYPIRRLLDATACMRMARKSPDLKWPRTVPAAAKMVEWLELAGYETLAGNLAKWRSGRTLTAARFNELWDVCFQFVPEADRPSAPLPMLYAATVFTELFIQGSLTDRDLTFVSPDPAYYQHWWEIQRVSLETGPLPPRFGTKQWMPELAT